MTNRDSIRRHLSIIKDSIASLEFYCETEMVGDDCRHLLDHIHGADRQHARTDAENLEETWQIKPLYDRIKLIQTSLRVLRNTLEQSEKAAEEALESCDAIASEVEDDTDSEL
ncbi:hypothetical protein UFOVP1118_11 [uncultured Caudovirales phage]|jgi:hypothetical protein|uniref:Uncharacterized protein n=1 Tax=uncultured Caudovirales phage TaxID=2100421 RepID=A0A6J5QK59_9CAUD|nr:hypothetical protein UFOVP1118_11 [uncultured Caudovirales phage]